MIDVTVPVQCQVKDSRLFLTESSKVREPALSAGKFILKVTHLLLIGRESHVRWLDSHKVWQLNLSRFFLTFDMAQSVKICRHQESLKSKIAKFEWLVEIEPRYTCSSAEWKFFTDVCMMGDNTNVCKMSRLWGVMSTLAFDLLLSNLASLLMLRRSFQRCWLIFAKWCSSKPQQRQSYCACFYCHFLHFSTLIGLKTVSNRVTCQAN